MINNMYKKWLVLFYGRNIIQAMKLDKILKDISLEENYSFSSDRVLNNEEKEILKQLTYLVSEGYLCKSVNNFNYNVGEKGHLFLAGGGYTAEAKKSLNALYAFRFSIISIIIACISLGVTYFSKKC